MSKLVIISLDLMLALPIVSIAFILVFSSIRGSQGSMLDSASFEERELRAFTASQSIAGKLDASALNLSGAAELVKNASNQYEVSVTLAGLGGSAECSAGHSVCRLVTLSNSVYILVVRYENTS